MRVSYLIFCLSVATVLAEPPAFMGLLQQNERALPLKVHAAEPHIYQQLPPEHSFTDFLPPSASYSAPASSVNQDLKIVDFEIPSDDSYNAAFLHSTSQQHQHGYDHGPVETQVHKHIYVHAPPKDFEQDEAVQPRVIHQTAPKQKHYRIVFIKAPEAPSVRTPIVSPLPQNEEKTLIYVLHKKPETHPDILLPTPEPTKPSKPEVYFIKYKNSRQEAPIYGPPLAFNEIQSRQAEENNNIVSDNFMPVDLKQNEVEFTTQQPQYREEVKQQHSMQEFVTEEPLVQSADFRSNPTESNFVNEEIQATTVEPLDQYLPPETTLAPIVVKEMAMVDHLPATTYEAPKRNRFFIKRRK